MAEFQRKTIPFQHNGMNWNTPVEKLADGQIPWAKNVRVLERGAISSAHGYSDAFPGHHLGDKYLHSLSRLNILNLDYNQNLRRNWVMGGDTELFVFSDGPSLTNPALNPVPTPQGQFGGFSGNPLSIVDMQPVDCPVAWKYIGDSKQMVTVGYYPTDSAGTQPARCLTMGLPVPVNESIPSAGGAGNLGTNPGGADYQWCFAYRRTTTGARSNPSAATRKCVGPTCKPTLHLVSQSANMILPQVPNDPQTGAPDPKVVVDVYRFGGAVLRWALVGSGTGGQAFNDNIGDFDLLAAPGPPQATDPVTGLTRNNMFQPFITADVARSGNAHIDAIPLGNGGWVLHFTGNTDGHTLGFNPNWLAGSTITVFDHAFTIYQVIDSNRLELMEDATGILVRGQSYPWSIGAGTLMAGQPLAHLWGPYGIGQSGAYIFACGDQSATGTLYWTNGNDPDSTDVVNSIIVTSPSEKLVTGCVYNGQPFCWSTERQFQIIPSLTVFGQFTTQEIAGAKGVWLEWSLSVQSNGFADQSITWRGKDGIYDWSAGGALQRLTDSLYAFFPHDGHPGIAPESIMPFIGATSEHPERVGNLADGSDAQGKPAAKYHRTCWFHGLLFYDFLALTEDTSGASVNTWSTLVWDTVNIQGGGWVSLDQIFPTTTQPVARFVEIGANDAIDIQLSSGGALGAALRGGNVKVTWGGTVYDYYGFTRGFETRIVTRAEDMGDSRAPKLWGDYWLDCTPWTEITSVPLVNFNLANITPNTIPQPAGFPPPPTLPPVPLGPIIPRTQYVLDFFEWTIAGGKGLLNNTLGLDIRWLAPDGQYVTSINQWQPSYIIKPEILEFRVTDPNDAGAVQAKYLMGMNMEANTNVFDGTPPSSFVLNVIVDNKVIAQPIIQHDGQSIKPYAWEPVAGYEFQVQLSYPQFANWQLFKINWIFEPWPDAVARKYPFTSLGETGDKFIQGIVLPMETNGEPATVGVWFDDTNQTETWTKSTLPLKKTGVVLDMPHPITAHFIQFQTLTPHRIWPAEAKVIWEPIPELTNTWQTQETDFDMATWHHLRDCFIAYMGGSGTPILSITDEYETVQYPLDPVSPGQFIRCYRVLEPMKAKWHSFRIDAPGGIRLYVKDTAVRVKEWGSTGPYVNAAPFGDQSRIAGARI